MQTIEEFTEKDAGELEKLFKKVWSHSSDYPPDWRRRRQLKKRKIVEEMRAGYHYFGARNEKREIVGVYKLIMTEEGCFGEHQSILPECTDRGIASAMYDHFIAYAKMHHCKKNYVNILDSHEVCRHLMEKYGFCKVGDIFEQAEGMKVQRYERWLDE